MNKFERLCNEYRENKRLIEELEALTEALKADIISLMGDSEVVTEGSTKATYKTVTAARIDSKALKTDYPDIANAYIVETQYKRFTVA